jgi:hypothetical protein
VSRLQWVAIVAGVVALVFGLNWVTQRGSGADPERVRAAETWLREHGRPWSLHDCQRQAGSPDESTIQCVARAQDGDHTVYASFTADGAVADVCRSDDDACGGFRPPSG